MQVTEILADGLKREFQVVVPATELDERLTVRLTSLKSEVKLKGFRPGKVPMSHMRKMFGRSAMAEIVQSVLSEVARDTLSERGEKAAMQPDFKLPENEDETSKVLAGEADLSYTMAFDVLPEIKLTDFKNISVVRTVAEVADEAVTERLNELAESTVAYETKSDAAATGDQITVSYLGKLDGEPFEGGADDNAVIKIREGQFIPGFIEELVGLKTGDKKTFKITFPADYGAAALAGKEAEFDVEVKGVAAPEELKIDDQLAERVGLESLDALKTTIKEQAKSQYQQAGRQKIKRQMLDQLAEQHQFDLPQRLVEQEFESIWKQATSEMETSGKSFEDEDTTEEDARKEYREIAERRVRLGLVMSEIGQANQIDVTEEEMQKGMAAQMRQFPGQEQALMEFYKTNPDAIAALRAPIFEEKVVDYLLELVSVTEKTVSPEQLLSEDEDEETPEKK
jgi:trigger factor